MTETSGTTVLCDIACELGEGPSYDADTNTLWWLDITGRKLLGRPFPDGPTRVHDLPFMASAIASVDDRMQVLATEKGLFLRERASGTLILLRDIEGDDPSTRSNDSRVHPCGAIWVGTMAKDERRAAGAIYWFFRGELRTLWTDVSIPNSICFSPDGTVAYFTDTLRGRLMRVDCDPATGYPTGDPKVFLDWKGREGWLDGSVVDAEGTLWNARWGAGAVDAWSPQGRHLRTIRVPARQSSCPAFAGPDASRLVVTSAWKGLDAAARAADPLAGMTFLAEIAVRGRFEPRARIA